MIPGSLLALMLFADAAAIQQQVKRARELIQAERVPEALEVVKAMLDSNPGNPEAEYQAGALMQELAASRFARLEAVAPDSAEVHELLGHRYAAQGMDKEALEEYRSALRKQPNRNGLRYAIGSALWRVGDRDGALAEFQEEVRRNPGHTLANLRAGQALVLRGETEPALPYLETAVKANPNMAESRRELGRALSKLGQAARAREHLEYVAKARPQDDQVHALLAAVYRALGEREKARAELKLHQAILDRKAEEAREAFGRREE